MEIEASKLRDRGLSFNNTQVIRAGDTTLVGHSRVNTVGFYRS